MSLGIAFTAPEPVPAKVEPEVGTEISTYDFNGMALRVVQIDGEPWFVAKDVCDALSMSNPTESLRPLGADERAKTNLGQKGLHCVNVISESGLYKLITRSDKPEAKPFQEWVTRDVLPYRSFSSTACSAL